MKKGRIISSMLVLIMASGFVLSGCGKADAKYFAKVSQYEMREKHVNEKFQLLLAADPGGR